MKIKDRRLELNWSNLLFKRIYSNIAFFIVLAGIFINYIFGLMGYNNLSVLSLLLINFIFVAVFIGGAIGPGEILKESYSNTRTIENKNDLKKSAVYTIIYILVSLFLFYNETPKPSINIHKKISYVKFVDFHGTKDSYGIKYYTKDGINIYTDDYIKEKDRTQVYNKIFKNGKVVVDMDYYNRNGKKMVEISFKKITL